MADSSHVNGNGNGAAAVDQTAEDTADCADIDSVCATIGKTTLINYTLVSTGVVRSTLHYMFILLTLYILYLYGTYQIQHLDAVNEL